MTDVFTGQHGGQTLPSHVTLAKATHVVLQHQQQAVYAEAVQQQKILVSHFWVLACAQAQRMLPISNPVRLMCTLPMHHDQ